MNWPTNGKNYKLTLEKHKLVILKDFFFLFLKKKGQLLHDIDDVCVPEQSQALNLVLIGYKAAGKSSLINTLKAVVRNSGQVCTVVPAYGPNHGCTTKRVSLVQLYTTFLVMVLYWFHKRFIKNIKFLPCPVNIEIIFYILRWIHQQ